MKRMMVIAGALTVLLLVLPEVAYACPVCFDSRDENRQAFFATAVLLTVLPLGMVGSMGLWMRKRFQEIDESEKGSLDQDAPNTDA